MVSRADGTVWVLGGFDDTLTVRGETWILRSDGEWARGPDLPRPLHHLPAVEVDGTLYIFGGLRDVGFEPVREVWALPSGRDTWEARAPLPAPLGAAAIGVLDGFILLAGGLAGPTTSTSFRYDPAADRWDILPALPAARDHGVGGGADRFFVIGGREERLTDVRADVWEWVAGSWQVRAPLPTARAGAAAATLPDGRVVVLGGEGERVYDDVESYDPERDAWTRWAPMPLPVHGTAAVPYDDGLLIPGGADRVGFAAVDTVQVLAP